MNVTYITFFILSAAFSTATYAQENITEPLTSEEKVMTFTAAELLNKARQVKDSDTKKSIELANEALLITTDNGNHFISAQIHNFLAKLDYQPERIEKSLHYFPKALFRYEKINGKQNQIIASLYHLETLLRKKKYHQVEIVVDELLDIVKEYGDKWLIGLTLNTSAWNAYEQKKYHKAVEQYLKAASYFTDDNKIIKKQLAQNHKMTAQSYKRIKNREKTAYYYEESLKLFEELGEQKLIARTLNTLAEAERYLGNLVVALDYSLRGIELHKSLEDPEGRAKSLAGAGIIYRHIGRYEKSGKHVHEAHLYYKKVNNYNGIAETSNQLGFIYTRLKQYDLARSFYQLSIDLSDKIKPKILASALREMAVIDLNTKLYESAMVRVKQAHQIYHELNDTLKSSRTARVIADIYKAEKDNDNAIKYYEESLSLAKEVGDKLYEIKAQNGLASVLVGNDNKRAISLLNKSLKLSKKINNKVQTLYVYRNFRRAHKLLGNVSESLYYAEKELVLSVIIQKEKDDNHLVLEKAYLHSYKMEIELASLKEKSQFDQLELAKKNNEIAIAEQTKIITDLELTKNKYAKITLALLLAICVFLVAVVYRRFIVSKKRNRELRYLAARDPLTNSYNRRVLFERMNEDFANIKLLDEYCIIMADIDHFKNVNDTYGHNIGDAVICNIANILQSCVRQNDIVSRYGGEEFCVVLRRVPQNQAIDIAETMRSQIENSTTDNISVTCSFGVASIQNNVKTPSELIERADIALYKSKSSGRNQVTLWDPMFNDIQ